MGEFRIFKHTNLVEIYNYYIENTTFTYETEPITEVIIEERVKKVTEKFPWLVYVDQETVVGYAYAGTFNPRAAYQWTVETSVYLRKGCERKGYTTKREHFINEPCS